MVSFRERLSFEGSLDDLFAQVASDLELGALIECSVIEVGFEDCNVKLLTGEGSYVAKVYSIKRTEPEINRNVEILNQALVAGINHPDIISHDGRILHTDVKSGLRMVVMKFINGKTFYDLSRVPDDNELSLIATEAVKINSIKYEPPYLFDSWAIPNMKWMYDKTRQSLSYEGRTLVESAFTFYDAIPIKDLPRCFVHGDLIKTNLIRGDDGRVYVIDFSVANLYPRIQELAVMAANLLFDENSDQVVPLKDRVERVTAAYLTAGGELTDLEKRYLFNYSLPGVAMEYMGSVNERLAGDESDEIVYWERLGFESLRQALGT